MTSQSSGWSANHSTTVTEFESPIFSRSQNLRPKQQRTFFPVATSSAETLIVVVRLSSVS